MKPFTLFLIFIGLAPLLSHCGYGFRQSKNEFLQNEGIEKVYLAPVENKTDQPGVQTEVYNAVKQTISAQNLVELVPRPENSDAILQGSVKGASYDKTHTTGVQGDVRVADQYKAKLSISFSLIKRRHLKEEKPQVWSSSFSRSKIFRSSAQKGPEGATASLINESLYERATGDLAEQLAKDLNEELFDLF